MSLILSTVFLRPTARCSAPETYEDGSAQEEQGEVGHSSGHYALAVLRGPEASDAMARARTVTINYCRDN